MKSAVCYWVCELILESSVISQKLESIELKKANYMKTFAWVPKATISILSAAIAYLEGHASCRELLQFETCHNVCAKGATEYGA